MYCCKIKKDGDICEFKFEELAAAEEFAYDSLDNYDEIDSVEIWKVITHEVKKETITRKTHK